MKNISTYTHRHRSKIRRITPVIFVMFITVFTSLVLLPSRIALADANNTIGVCKVGDNIDVVDLSIASEVTICQNIGGTIIKAGEPVPFSVCVYGKIITKNSSSKLTQLCTKKGGKVIDSGKPLPVISNGTQTEKTFSALCQIGSGFQQINSSVASETKGCTDLGGTVFKVGDSAPVPVCIVGDHVQAITDNNESSRTTCRAIGGTPIEAGQPLTPVVTDVVDPGSPGAKSPAATTQTTPNPSANCDANNVCRPVYDPDLLNQCADATKCSFTDKFIKPAVIFLSAGVGLIVTIM
ncbi:MAG: hypothetical protein WCO19_02935, partial [Candidatus Saccharibacteria bacterium]